MQLNPVWAKQPPANIQAARALKNVAYCTCLGSHQQSCLGWRRLAWHVQCTHSDCFGLVLSKAAAQYHIWWIPYGAFVKESALSQYQSNFQVGNRCIMPMPMIAQFPLMLGWQNVRFFVSADFERWICHTLYCGRHCTQSIELLIESTVSSSALTRSLCTKKMHVVPHLVSVNQLKVAAFCKLPSSVLTPMTKSWAICQNVQCPHQPWIPEVVVEMAAYLAYSSWEALVHDLSGCWSM